MTVSTAISTYMSVEYIPTMSLQRYLYGHIYTIKPEMFIRGIYSKPEILLQSIQGFMILPKQVKPKAPKSWLSLHSSLQLYAKLFYTYTGYYVIGQNTNNNAWNIRKQAIGISCY